MQSWNNSSLIAVKFCGLTWSCHKVEVDMADLSGVTSVEDVTGITVVFLHIIMK